MAKCLDLSKYRKPLTKKKLKNDLIKILLIGLIWFLALMSPWLFWLRPYKEFGYYEAEAVYNNNIFIVDAEHLRIIYKINGIEYEKTIWFHTTRYAKNELSFYYQLDNPYYTIDMRNTLLIVFPCVASAGLILCGWAIWQYKREIKELRRNLIKDIL